METNERVPLAFRRSLLISVGAVLVLGLVSFGLFAQQKPSTSQKKTDSSLSSLCSPAPSSTDPNAAAADAAALLPVIPTPPDTVSHFSPPPGVSLAAPAPSPDRSAAPDANAFKSLYGYYGPYFNTANLDGKVIVLDTSVFTWSTSTWKVTGMLRNQTRCSVRITGLTARLIGPHGEPLATATTTVPVDFLRPGEPGPFEIEAPHPGGEVTAIDWHVDYVFAQAAPRMFQFKVYEDGLSEGGTRYDLGGTIRNLATTTARDTRVTVAWLDYEGNGRVRYVTSAKLRYISDPRRELDALDLGSGAEEDFLFITNDPKIAPLLGEARIVLWGTSK